MTARDYQEWQRTPAGEFAGVEGISHRVDLDAVERHIAEVRSTYRVRFGRELTDSEVAAVRRGGEMRSLVSTGGRSYQSAHELAAAHNWGVVVAPRNRGFAMRGPDGQWTPDSDPSVVAASEASEEARRVANEAAYESWRTGPAIMRTIAGPS